MSMRPFSVVFRMTDGHSIPVGLPELEAKTILRKWLAGGYKPGEKVGNVNDEGPWGVSVDHIVAIQVTDMATIMRLQQEQTRMQVGPALQPWQVQLRS